MFGGSEKRPVNENNTTLREERDRRMYSHRAASKTAIDRLERSIELMGTMPEQIAEAHVRFMGYDLPANCSASVKRGKLLKLLSDEVLREAKQAEREEFVAKAAAKTNASAAFEGKDRGRDEKNANNKNTASSPRHQNSSSISSNRRVCDDDGDDNSTETKIVNGGGRYNNNNNNNNNNNKDSDSDSDSSVQGTERAAPPPRSPSPPLRRVNEHAAKSTTNTYADSDSELEESEEDPDNYYGKAALEPEAPPGSNPFATITSEKQKEMEKEALRQVEEAKKMMADLKFNNNNNNNNDDSNNNSSDDDGDGGDNNSINNISSNNNKNEDDNIPIGGLSGGEQHQYSKLKYVSFPPIPIEDDVRSIRSDAVSSRGGDDVGSVKDFGGSEYGGSIYSVAATMGSNQNEQEDDEKLLDQLVEEAEVERGLRGRIDEEEGDGNVIDDTSEGKENEVPLSL